MMIELHGDDDEGSGDLDLLIRLEIHLALVGVDDDELALRRKGGLVIFLATRP